MGWCSIALSLGAELSKQLIESNGGELHDLRVRIPHPMWDESVAG
jgi:hypothetical protein